MSLVKKFLLALLVVAVVTSSSFVLIAQLPVLTASNRSSGSNITPTMTVQTTNIEAETTTSVNNRTTSYAEQIMADCEKLFVSDTRNDIHCPVLALDKLNKIESRQTVLGTLSDLVMLYDESYNDCHNTAHHLGSWLYGYTTNLKEALSYATPLLCGGAVFHGIFQSYFSTDDFRNVGNNHITIKHLCPVSQENVNWIYERDCFHGIGHGLAELYNYSTRAAVDRCSELEMEWAQSACSKGVFMENVIRYLHVGDGDFDRNDIYFPCDRTVEKFVPQCYDYHASYLFNRSGYNLTAALAQCDNISPIEFAKYCYQGMGRVLADSVYRDVEEANAFCYLGNQSSYHDDCLRGMLRTALKQDVKTDVGFEFCSVSRPDFKTECYEIMGMWIKALFAVPNQHELERECSKAHDVHYISICINANPDIRLISE